MAKHVRDLYEVRAHISAAKDVRDQHPLNQPLGRHIESLLTVLQQEEAQALKQEYRSWLRKQPRFQPYRPYWASLPYCINGFRHLHKDSQGVADGTSGQDFYVFDLDDADEVCEILEAYNQYPDGLQINSMYDCTGQEFRHAADIRVHGGRTYVTQLWGYDV
jgi:hypothetical protein